MTENSRNGPVGKLYDFLTQTYPQLVASLKTAEPYLRVPPEQRDRDT